MDLTIDAAALKKALTIPKAVMPRGYGVISHGVRLVAMNDGLVLQGTDVDALTATKVPAVVARPGTILVSIKDLDPLLKSNKGSVRLVVDTVPNEPDTLQFVNGMTTTVRSLSDDEWPRNWPSFDKAPSFELDLDHVAEVLPATSLDEARPILTGVYFAPGGEMVATDSYRLHVGYTHEGPDEKLLVPGGTLAQVLKVVRASKTPTTVRLAYLPAANNAELFRVQITAGPNTWYCHTISGEFPNYQALIPKSYPHKLIAEKAPLLAMLTKLDGIIKDKREPVRFVAPDGVTVPADKVTISHHNGETQAVTTADLAARWDGPEMQFAFTNPYLLAMVAACREDEVVLAALDALKPFMIGESHPDGTRSIRLIMPVRLT
jgi:DNA polymerase III sliding clamp (beta) subunit (PCNA family)